MALDHAELSLVSRFLRGADPPPREVLTKVELGLWVFPPFPFGSMNIFGPDSAPPDTWNTAPLFLSGRFGAEQSMRLMRMFRDRLVPYLLIRVHSWEAHIVCNGEVLTEHCEENLDAIREACERLRRRCNQKHPPVVVKS